MSTKEQLQRIEHVANRVWDKFTPYQVQEQLLSLWDDLSDQVGLAKGFEPLYRLSDEDSKISCAILGSGGFSTGREELARAAALENKLGFSPVSYSAVISNRERSDALTVADEFGLPGLVVDYTEWRKKNDVSGSTKLFGFAADEAPTRAELEDRLKIKKAYDSELHAAMEAELNGIPESISLRGYDFILTDKLFSADTEVDNTHPASLIIREDDGEPAYAGWQESAYNKMVEDGFTSFQTTLIRVGWIGSYDDLTEVDAGEMLAISPGNQGQYDKVEDHYLLTLKATGLLPYFWGLSKEPADIQYLTKNNKVVNIRQRQVIVGDKILSGRNVFGQTIEDLDIFLRVMKI